MFDYIMGVGRTPQITKDIFVNPFNFIGITDIAYLATIKDESYDKISGSILELIDENNAGGNIISTINFTNLKTEKLILDFGKSIFFNKIALIYKAHVDTKHPIMYIEVSEDGTNYDTKATFEPLPADSDLKTSLEVNYVKGRFVRFRWYNYAIGSLNQDSLYKISVFPESLQYI